MIPSFKITLATPKDSHAWDSYVLGHSKGIAYQLYGFRHAVETAYGFKGVYFIARKGTKICGILPLVHLGVPGTHGSLVSLPYCDAAGILADSPDVEKRLVISALGHARQFGIPKLTIRSVRPFAGIDPELTRHRGKVRMLLPLSYDPNELMAGLQSKVRSQVKKSLRNGLIFRMGGIELVDRFYGVFRENMRDLGSPVHSLQWIHQILAGYKNRAHIGMVYLSDRTPAAAGLILCHPNGILIPWASSLRRFNRFNPNMLLYWNFLQFASAHGYPMFDFGRSTPGEGTFRFKKQWGSIPGALHWADFDPDHGDSPMVVPKASPSKYRPHVETLLSHMPIPLMTWIGSHIRKFISL